MAATQGLTGEQQRRRGPRAAASLAAPAALFAVLIALYAVGAIAPIDNALMDARFRLVKRAPSDSLVLVEIDPRSLRAETRWPWPRDRYAAATANLQDAGAALIAFDVDFSSRSDPAGDLAFAEALSRRPGEVVLPVFWQWSASDGNGGRELVRTPPNRMFLNDAVIASVTLTTEKNGVLRRGWRAVEDGGAYRTSLAGVLAGVSANRRDTFYIDYGIDAAEIKRLSFNDVLNGGFPPEAVRGKNVLIGATALELGDEFAAPVLGITPGVTLHALSYESLVQDRALTRPAPAIPLALAALLLVWLTRKAARQRASDLALKHAALLATLFAAPLGAQALFPVSFDTGAMIAAQALAALYVAGAQLHHRAREIISHRAATMRYQELTGIVVRDNGDGVIVTDGAGAVELCNERAKTLLGIEGEPAGKDIARAAEGFPALPAAHTGLRETAFCEFAAPATGAVLEIIATRSATPAGRTREGETDYASGLVVYTLRDISARKRIEEAERKAKEAAIAANAAKTQLISNMSHELRTPLNGVIGFASIMKDEAFGVHATPEYKEYSKNIHDSGKRLLGLVNNMLNVAKLDAGEFEIVKDRAPVDEVIDKTLHEFRHEILRRDAKVVLEIEKALPDATIDASIVNEMLSQLLANALKFTGDRPVVTFRAFRNGRVLTIEVEDNGCGAPPAQLPKLARAFVQGDGALNRSHEGAGLGLYLVSKFAALHGGALSLESEPGERFLARMTFSDAFRAAAAPSAAPPRQERSAS